MKKEPGRCTGHCCTCVTIPFTPKELQEQYDVPRGTPGRKTDIDELYEMLIPLGEFPANPLMKVHMETWAQKALKLGTTDTWREKERHDSQFFYTCRHLKMNGDCGNYENRPAMCRDYPNGHICGFDACTMPLKDQIEKADLDSNWVTQVLIREIKDFGLIPPMSLVRRAKANERQRGKKYGKEGRHLLAVDRTVVNEFDAESATVTPKFARPSMKMRVKTRRK